MMDPTKKAEIADRHQDSVWPLTMEPRWTKPAVLAAMTEALSEQDPERLDQCNAELEQRLAAQARELAELLEYGRVTRNTLQKTVEQLSQAEADLEHAERNEEEQALTIQILTGRLSQAQAALRLAQNAMRAPLDDWKGEVERKALDAARAALSAQGQGGGGVTTLREKYVVNGKCRCCGLDSTAISQAQADARRYRWLLSMPGGYRRIWNHVLDDSVKGDHDSIDSAIDAALSAQGQGK